MKLLDNLGAQSLSQPGQSFGIGHLLGANMGKLAIQQIAAHFPFQFRKAPIADVLENQHPQYHFGGCARPAMRTAARVPLQQGVMDRLQEFFVRQDGVCMAHPGFPQLIDCFANKPIAEIALPAANINHGYASATWNRSYRHAELAG